MATDPALTNFDASAVRAGIRLAMAVGLPVIPSDQPTFFMPTVVTAPVLHSSPYDPAYRPVRVTPAGIKVPCAVDYKDAAGTMEAAGVISSSGVVLTLLDEDYVQIQGFAYVVIGGEKFAYQRTEKPNGLVSVGVYTIHCLADDDG